MSNNLLVVGGSFAPRTARPHLSVVPDRPVASVSSIHDAPSARRRRQRLREEDPSMRRVPRGVRREREVVTVSVAALLRPVVRVGAGLLALASLTAGAAGLGLATQSSYDGPTQVHHVVAGESLWGLASRVGAERPLEEVVADIEALNDLDGGLTPGQPVVLPLR